MHLMCYLVFNLQVGLKYNVAYKSRVRPPRADVLDPGDFRESYIIPLLTHPPPISILPFIQFKIFRSISMFGQL